MQTIYFSIFQYFLNIHHILLNFSGNEIQLLILILNLNIYFYGQSANVSWGSWGVGVQLNSCIKLLEINMSGNIPVSYGRN